MERGRERGRRALSESSSSNCRSFFSLFSASFSHSRPRILSRTSRHRPSRRLPCRSPVRRRESPTPWRTEPGRRRNVRRCSFESSSKRGREAFGRPRETAAPPRGATFAVPGSRGARSSCWSKESANESRRGRNEAERIEPSSSCRNRKMSSSSSFVTLSSFALSLSRSMLLARATAAAAMMRLSSFSRAASTSSASLSSHSSRSCVATTKTQHPQFSILQLTRRRIVSVASSSASSSSPSEASSKLEPPDVRKLAKMAQLEVTDEEVSGW